MDPRTKFEIIEHGSESYVAGLLDGEVVASCLLVPEAAVVRMKRVAVASSLQGGGIGTHMLQFCEAHARTSRGDFAAGVLAESALDCETAP